MFLSTTSQQITGSSFFVDTETSDTEASSSTAEGVGLVGGVAGEPLLFTVQANDKREREVQALIAWAEVRREIRFFFSPLGCAD